MILVTGSTGYIGTHTCISQDIAKCYADPTYAKHILGWEKKSGLTT
jgi:UDP-glucose 4-epimerase